MFGITGFIQSNRFKCCRDLAKNRKGLLLLVVFLGGEWENR